MRTISGVPVRVGPGWGGSLSRAGGPTPYNTREGGPRAVRQMQLFRDGRWLAGPIEVAESALERMRGLLGREGLPGRSGMWIEGTGLIHTWFMRFAIDAVFLARDGTVLKVSRAVKPYRFAGRPWAGGTLELPSGLAAEVALEPGQRLELRAGPVEECA